MREFARHGRDAYGLGKTTSMADVRVSCVLRTGTTHESITHLGGKGSGSGWCWPKEKVIDSILQKTNTFYTLEDQKRADVVVIEATPPYLRTVADGQYTNNLLALPACPRT